MGFRTGPKISAQQHLADFARVQVRAGLLSSSDVLTEVTTAAREELRAMDPEAVAESAIDTARDELAIDQAQWPEITDYDRLQASFTAMEQADVVVMQAVDDHWQAAGELTARDEADERVSGIAWFTAPDVWHAVDAGMLELNLWHGDSANVALGDALLDHVIAVLAEHGLAAHFDEGRIEISAFWQRRV